ncbi:hypothetical protein JKF63_07381 [Porcisia hertigi]|uniref:LSM domain-containing protein n=1 Tax=Porcisia hertigi TaxID=2761500 RepID=A0A836LL25_9TRYP|nr:hypothetical protein JKF63_07381 [Porcisia hertigi]
MDSISGMDEGVGPSSSATERTGVANISSSAPTDPFAYLAQHIHKQVVISLMPVGDDDGGSGGAVVRGTLLSVDDLCNVMVQHWSSTDTVRLDGGIDNGRQQQQQPRKRARLDAAANGEGEESVRLIRGAQIVSIALRPDIA